MLPLFICSDNDALIVNDNEKNPNVVNEDDKLPVNTPYGRMNTTDTFLFPFNMEDILQQFTSGMFINIPDIIKDMETSLESFEALEIAPPAGNTVKVQSSPTAIYSWWIILSHLFGIYDNSYE